MTATEITPATTSAHPLSGGRRAWHFTRHYLEMVVAMYVGMFVLGGLEHLAFPHLTLSAELELLVMATDMAIGMGAWMRVRRHSRRSIVEMSASMYLPFLVLLVPFWAGAIGEHAVMTWGHVLMFPAMALVMVIHPDDYLHH